MTHEPTAYDSVRYRTDPNPVAHPGRLAAIGRLHGLDCADVERMRVLEVGCGDGGHLLPLAAAYPAAEFVGFDLAGSAIADARRRAAAASLRNVRFEVADVRSMASSGDGAFDVVVAHGVYSWIPADARRALLDTCAKSLAPNGIAFVSYNTMPGGHLRRMAREILLFHVAGLDEASRLTEARALARFLSRDDDRENPFNAALRYEMRQIAERPDQALRHDDLAEHHHPAYFHEFVADASACGLQFLAEAEYFAMNDAGLSDATRATLASMDRIASEQYRDFLRGRRFRQTLLCRGNRPLRAVPDEREIERCYVSTTLPHVQRLALRQDAPAPTPEAGGVERTVRALLDCVAAALPGDLSMPELVQALTVALGAPLPAESVRARVLDGFRAGTLQLSTCRTRAARRAPPQPRTSAYARLQAEEGETVANAQLLTIRLDDARARALFTLLDGTRARRVLCAEMASRGHRDADDAWIEACLARFAHLGLLLDE